MKLFDRSVDLAQFREDTPLYPICRAWIKNQPNSHGLSQQVESKMPENESEVFIFEIFLYTVFFNW